MLEDTSLGPQGISLEWQILQDLGWLLSDRLRLAERSSISKNFKIAARCELLETELRETFITLVSMDFDFDFSKDEHLIPAVQLLESAVNPHFISISMGVNSDQLESMKSKSSFALSLFEKYPRLFNLIEFLKMLTENLDQMEHRFYLVSGSGSHPAIFHIPSFSIAKEVWKKISGFRESLVQAGSLVEMVNRKRPRARSPVRDHEDWMIRPTRQSNDPKFRKHASALFGVLYGCLACESHKVMFRPEKQGHGDLDLFLSSCRNPDEWQEIGCVYQIAGGPNCIIKSLCETLPNFTDHRVQLMVEINGDSCNIHFYEEPASKTHSGAAFSDPLEKLIADGLLQRLTFQNSHWLPDDVFSNRDKCILAFKLGCFFLNFFDAEFTKRSWNSASIVFLVPPDRKRQEGFLYIRCSPRATCEEEPSVFGNPALIYFARLLLEIHYGEAIITRDEDLGPNIIFSRISQFLTRARAGNGSAFLDAVAGCLSLAQRLNETEEPQEDAIIRQLMYEKIVRHLEKNLEENTASSVRTALRIPEAMPSNLAPTPQLARWVSASLSNPPQDEAEDDRRPRKRRATMAPKSRDGFTVAIICALPLETDAVRALFDETYGEGGTTYGKQPGDENIYTTGRIGQHNIVLCHLPIMGTPGAASVTSSLRISFPCIRLALVVGICGAVPFSLDKAEIILGDIVISNKVIKNGPGKQYPDGFQQKYDTWEPNREIQGLLRKLEGQEEKKHFQQRTFDYLQILQDKRGEYDYPGVEYDRLFPAKYNHQLYRQGSFGECICFSCRGGKSQLCREMQKRDCDTLGCIETPIQRDRHTRKQIQPLVHIGKVASGDIVMKSGIHRDRLAKDEEVIGFEMEGAGVSDNIPCLVIKGVSDYADSHKNNMWQPYAAASAASGAKAFLDLWASNT
ncbi:hypothetical protein ABW19_dt0202343 [Dactylella cylindrospora]|nr:hypothetical protein ABW19_dt0202343 [Dactylella cylindrospora]